MKYKKRKIAIDQDDDDRRQTAFTNFTRTKALSDDVSCLMRAYASLFFHIPGEGGDRKKNIIKRFFSSPKIQKIVDLTKEKHT